MSKMEEDKVKVLTPGAGGGEPVSSEAVHGSPLARSGPLVESEEEVEVIGHAYFDEQEALLRVELASAQRQADVEMKFIKERARLERKSNEERAMLERRSNEERTRLERKSILARGQQRSRRMHGTVKQEPVSPLRVKQEPLEPTSPRPESPRRMGGHTNGTFQTLLWGVDSF